MFIKFCVILWIFIFAIFGQSSQNCEEPPPAANTIRQWQGSDVSYSCYPHHVLVSGDLYRSCKNGSYEGQEPICEFDCGTPRRIYGATYAPGPTLSGSTVTYECESAYIPSYFESPDNQCDEDTKQWAHTQFRCYDRINHALNKPTFHNGYSASVVVDEIETTCSTLISDRHLIEIQLGTVMNVVQMTFTTGTELPNVNISVKNTNNNILTLCTSKTTPLSVVSKAVLYCRPRYSTRAPGDIVYVTTESTSPVQIEFCDLEVTATNYIGDCGKPPTQPGQKAWYTTTVEDSIATVSCIPPWHIKSGSQTIVCHITQWSQSLVCSCRYIPQAPDSVESNIAENAVTLNVGGELALDDDEDSCYQGVLKLHWAIDLLTLYEITSISVRFSVDSLQMVHHIKVSDNNGVTQHCQSEYPQDGVTLFNCTQVPIGRYINITADSPVNICDVKVHGKLHEGILECSLDPKGRDYRGYQDVTVFGKTCLPWSINSSFTSSLFPDTVTSSVANYCRNPTTFVKERPWCFINETEWEYCPVYKCSSFCKTTTEGFLFDGDLSIAVSNKTCERWKGSRFRHDLYGNRQQCQNTYKDQTQPWCITDIATNTFEYCAVPDCPTTVSPTITLMENDTGFDYENELQKCMHWSDGDNMERYNPWTIHINYKSTLLDYFCQWTEKPIIRMWCIFYNLELTFLDFICDPEAVTAENIESSISWSSETTVLESYTTESLQQSTPQSDSMSEIQSSTQSYIQPSTESLQQSTPHSDSMSEIHSSTQSYIQPSTTTESEPISEPRIYYITTASMSCTHDTDIILEPSSQESTTLQASDSSMTYSASASESSSLVTSTLGFATNASNRPCPCLCNNHLFSDEAGISVYKHQLIKYLLLDRENLSSTYRKKNSVQDNRPLTIATGSVGIIVIICVFLCLTFGDIFALYKLASRLIKT